MSRFLSVFFACSAFVLAFAGTTTGASAHYHHGCGHCRSPGPIYKYKTIYQYRHVTRYHDVSVSKTINRTYPVYHVRRIQPVIHINEVTRVHHHIYINYRPVYRVVTEHLPPIRTVYHSVISTYDYHCRIY